MAKFIVRRFLLLLLTMFLVSVAVFLITESSPGNVARNVLGAFVTPEQEASFLAQMGLDTPIHLRYLYWLVGSDWHASRKVGLPLRRITTRKGFVEWWAVREDGVLVRWKLQGEDLIAGAKTVDGILNEYKDNERWRTTADVQDIFWGVDNQNHVVKCMGTGWMESSGGPVDYIPLKKGFVRGDPGVSLRTGRPVAKSLYIRVRNSMVLAGIAFVLVMPLALLLGMLAGLKEGSLRDRLLSIGGMVFTVTPEFATCLWHYCSACSRDLRKGVYGIAYFPLAVWFSLLPRSSPPVSS
jgi:peptide/nickel transport system permease protein